MKEPAALISCRPPLYTALSLSFNALDENEPAGIKEP